MVKLFKVYIESKSIYVKKSTTSGQSNQYAEMSHKRCVAKCESSTRLSFPVEDDTFPFIGSNCYKVLDDALNTTVTL